VWVSGEVSFKIIDSRADVVVGFNEVNLKNISKNTNLIIGRVGGNNIKRGLESRGKQEGAQGVALEEPRGDGINVTIRSFCGDDVAISMSDSSGHCLDGHLCIFHD
jgi:hypothetical protein